MTLTRLDLEPIFTALAARVGVLEGGSYPGNITAAGNIAAAGNLTAPTVKGFTLGNGSAQLVVGDGTHTGNVEFLTADGTRQSYIGSVVSGGPLNFVSAGGYSFSGGTTLFDHLIYVQDAPGNPYIAVNIGNSTITGQIQFRDLTNIRASMGSVSATGPLLLSSVNGGGFSFTITGGTNFMTIGPSYTTMGSRVVFANDGNFDIQSVGSNPRFTVDANDYYYYNRSVNAHVFVIGGADQFTMTATACTVVGALNVGNDVNFGLNINGGTQPILVFDSGDNFSYVRSSNNFIWNIANTAVMGLTSSLLTLNVGMLLQNRSIQVYDANFNLNIPSGNPRITFDTNDYLEYDRTGNALSLVIGSTIKLKVSGTGVNIPLAQLATYADNTAATTGGLAQGDLYRTSTGQLMVRF